MRTKHGSEYKAASVNAAIAAIKRYLDSNSVLGPIDLYNKDVVPRFCAIADGKLKALAEMGNAETHGSDALEDYEISMILNHHLIDNSTPERLIRRLFIHNAILLGLRGGEHYSLKANWFKKRLDGGYDVTIYRSKTNQRGLNDNKGVADTLVIPNSPQIIYDYDLYLSRRPMGADPEFYLQEFPEEQGT